MMTIIIIKTTINSKEKIRIAKNAMSMKRKEKCIRRKKKSCRAKEVAFLQKTLSALTFDCNEFQAHHVFHQD